MVLILLGLGLHLAKHGEKRQDHYSFWWSLFATGLNVWLLYACGFFGAA
jgi:hypothetical protein